MTTYRTGNHQPRNLYRGDQYIGVMFDPIDAAAVARHLNMGVGECTCNSYEPRQGECCGVGMCSCSTTAGEPQPDTPSAYRVYSRWFKAGDTSRRAVYDAIQAAYHAGCASSAPPSPLSASVAAQDGSVGGTPRAEGSAAISGAPVCEHGYQLSARSLDIGIPVHMATGKPCGAIEHRPERRGSDSEGYGLCTGCGEMWPCGRYRGEPERKADQA